MKVRGYKAYSIITTLLWEAAVAAVVLRLLPSLGINVPLWGLISIMAVLGAEGYISYWLGKKALEQKPIFAPEVGGKCKAITSLGPKGYVQVGSERWQATSTGPTIQEGQEAVIVSMEGLTLFVAPLNNGEDESFDA